MNFYFVSYCLYTDVLTLQSFSERLQESFELHFLHRSQNVSCVQSFPLRFHGKVVRTVTRLTERRAIVLFKEWCDGSFFKKHWGDSDAVTMPLESNWILWISPDWFLPGRCVQHKHAGGLGNGSPGFLGHVHSIWELLRKQTVWRSLSQSCRTSAACYQETQAGWGKTFSYSDK